MFSEYSSARNFKEIMQKYYTNFLPLVVSQELQCVYRLGCAYLFYPLQTAVGTVLTLWQPWAGASVACSGHCIYSCSDFIILGYTL